MPAKYTELRLPTAGINEDGHPASLDANEAIELVNVLPHNPSALTRRSYYFGQYNDSTVTNAMVPVGAVINRGTLLVSYASVAANGTQDWFVDHAYPMSEPVSYSAGNFPTLTGRYNGTTAADTTGYTNDSAGTPDANILLPYQRGAYYEGVTYYPSLGPENHYAKAAGTASLIEGARLVAWAGAVRNHSAHTGTISINAGATTLTIPSGVTGSIVDSFVSVDSDDSSAAPFHYRIMANLGATTWRIEKPYGLGVTGVSNKASVNGVIRSRSIVTQSPAGVVCCAAHLDRIFVGRCWVRDAVSDLQPGYYNNALKWSQVLAPEKWPDQNVALINGMQPGEGITGLISIGRYLLIFSHTATYVMSGDSEENFTIRKLLGDVGCVDSRSIVEYDENVIWGSRRGLHMISPDLQVTELTQRKPGHGVRTTYQNAISGTSTQDWGVPAVTCAVDDNDYLHVMASSDPVELLANTPWTGLPYKRFPMSCHIPTRAWTRLQSTTAADSVDQVASPQMYVYAPFTTARKPVAVAHKMILDLTYLTNPTLLEYGARRSAVTDALMEGDVYYTGSFVETPFAIDIVLADSALNGYDTWQLNKLMVYHSVELLKTTTDAGFTGPQVYGYFDPTGTPADDMSPGTLLGGFKVRNDSNNGLFRGHSMFVSEISPRTSSDEDAMRGQFLRLRVNDVSTVMADYWELYKVVAVWMPGREGRATSFST